MVPEPETVPDGDIIDYTNQQLFSNSLDDLEGHIQRKKALAHPLRYAILHLLYDHTELPRAALVEATGKDGNALQHHLTPLLDGHLVEKVPHPSDNRRTKYRLTTFGRQEIEADRRHIIGEQA